MPLTINIAKLPSGLKRILLKEFNIQHKDGYKANSESKITENEPHVITLGDNENAEKVKRKLKDIFIKNRVRDFVVTSDKNGDSDITLLERNHVEKSGIYHCIHCGMEFESEAQLSVHHRIHYAL
jgi:hypothetical protein